MLQEEVNQFALLISCLFPLLNLTYKVKTNDSSDF